MILGGQVITGDPFMGIHLRYSGTKFTSLNIISWTVFSRNSVVSFVTGEHAVTGSSFTMF